MRFFFTVLFILSMALVTMQCAAGIQSCTQNRKLEHDFSIGGNLGASGSDFNKTNAPTEIRIFQSDCPGIPNSTEVRELNVTRTSNVLAISENQGTAISLSLAGDSISTGSLELDTSTCKQTLTKIEGTIDYSASKLEWTYTATYEQKNKCSALIKPPTLIN